MKSHKRSQLSSSNSTSNEREKTRKRKYEHNPELEKAVNTAYAAKMKQKELEEVKKSEYYHGKGSTKKELQSVKYAPTRAKLQHTEELAHMSAVSALKASEVLMPSVRGTLVAEGMSKTYQFRQEDLLANVGEGVKKKIFDLKGLEYGPYFVDYTRNGRHLLLGGRKGHISMFDTHTFKLATEINVNETIRDVQFLHDFSMFAVAQKKYCYIYDNAGTELHVLRNHDEPTKLQFLPYHYLLATGSKTGMIRYQDTSTGTIVAEHRTYKGEVLAMRQNKTNAIIHAGHNNGSVTLWSPNMGKPLVTMQCHQASLLSLAIDDTGKYMATAGQDGKLRTWDIRTYRQLDEYFTIRPATSMDISQSGLLSLGCGPHVQVWKDVWRTKAKSPYMYECYEGNIVNSIRYQPFEDLMCVGLQNRVCNMIIPSAGESNFDTFEANPFETKKQRQERTVRSLMEKLQPDMITLDTRAFNVMAAEDLKSSMEGKMQAAKDKLTPKINLTRHRAKGRNSSTKKAMRKKKNIVDKQTLEYRESVRRKEEERLKAKYESENNGQKNALDRFKS